jgi:hypothetical protein
VNPDGSYTLRSTSLYSLVRSSGQELRDDRANALDLAFGASGNLTHFLVGKGSAMAARIAGFSCFVAPPAPVAVGQVYRFTRAKGTDGLPESETAYTLTEVKGGEAAVKVSFRETSGTDKATGSGTWTVDAATGLPLKLELELTNFHTGLGDLVSYRLTRT